MKLRSTLSIVLIVVLAFAVAACSSEPAAASAAGTYVLESITAEGVTQNMSDLEALGMSAEDFSLTLEEDGTGALTMLGESVEVTWDETGITAEGDTDTISYTLEAGKLTLTEVGQTMVFARQ